MVKGDVAPPFSFFRVSEYRGGINGMASEAGRLAGFLASIDC